MKIMTSFTLLMIMLSLASIGLCDPNGKKNINTTVIAGASAKTGPVIVNPKQYSNQWSNQHQRLSGKQKMNNDYRDNSRRYGLVTSISAGQSDKSFSLFGAIAGSGVTDTRQRVTMMTALKSIQFKSDGKTPLNAAERASLRLACKSKFLKDSDEPVCAIFSLKGKKYGKWSAKPSNLDNVDDHTIN